MAETANIIIENNRFVRCVNTDDSTLRKISESLLFSVPGAEHSYAFKSNKWNGKTSFFQWNSKMFPLGLLSYVKRKNNIDFNVLNDNRNFKKLEFIDFKVEGNYPLIDYQLNGIKNSIDNNGGLIKVATNGGKTAIIAGIILSAAQAGLSVLCVTHRVNLLKQTKESIELSIGKEIGSIVSGGDINIKQTNIGMIGTITSLLKRIDMECYTDSDEEIFKAIKESQVIIVDECHHAIADTWRRVLMLNTNSLLFGCSGTIDSDSTYKGIQLRSIFGEVVIDVSNNELISREISAKPKVIMHEYSTDIEDAVKAYGVMIRPDCMKRGQFSVPVYINKMRKFVMENALINNKDYWDTIKNLLIEYKDLPTVVFVDWIDFADKLSSYLDIPTFYGKTKDRADVLSKFENGETNALIATSILDEGISINRIKVLIFACCGYSDRQMLQRLGRGLRKKKDDNTLILIDFIRFGHKYLLEPSKKRLKIWKDQGFDIEYK